MTGKMTFSYQGPASRKTVRVVSRAAATILESILADRDTAHKIHLAVSEACANVCLHAYPDSKEGEVLGPLTVHLTLSPGQSIEVLVLDQGVGFSPNARAALAAIEAPVPESESGRGLYIMSKAFESITVDRKDGTTTVRLRTELGNAAWNTSI